jgi:hypothetical protein
MFRFYTIDIILPAALWPGIDSASNRNEYHEYFLWVGETEENLDGRNKESHERE